MWSANAYGTLRLEQNAAPRLIESRLKEASNGLAPDVWRRADGIFKNSIRRKQRRQTICIANRKAVRIRGEHGANAFGIGDIG
jgi:hypothetical protein